MGAEWSEEMGGWEVTSHVLYKRMFVPLDELYSVWNVLNDSIGDVIAKKFWWKNLIGLLHFMSNSIFGQQMHWRWSQYRTFGTFVPFGSRGPIKTTHGWIVISGNSRFKYFIELFENDKTESYIFKENDNIYYKNYINKDLFDVKVNKVINRNG